MPKSTDSEPNPTKFTAIPGSARNAPANAEALELTPGNEKLQVTVRLRRRKELPALADSANAARLSQEEYENQHGAAPDEIERVEQFARECGLEVEYSSRARRSVLLSGTADAFSKAFHTELRQYRRAGATFRGRSGPIYIPKALANSVIGVFGLSNEPFARPHFQIGAHAAHATAQVPRGFTPTEIARRYNFPPGLTGKGQTVGIIELGGGFRQQELDAYFSQLGIPLPPKVKTPAFPGGGANSPGIDPLDPANPDVEVLLDIEVASAVAPEAQIVVYFAAGADDRSFLDVMTAAVHDTENKPNIISISWGGPESSATAQFQRNFDQVLQTAAHLGITVCVAAGDDGSADFQVDDPRWDGHAHVDFPASSPFALACGGTRLLGTTSSSGEVVWHPGPNEGTGGGVSRFFPLPDYQAAAGVPHAKNPAAKIRRGVPDVAGDAAQESGYRILCDNQFFPDPAHNPPLPPIGGTSAVAPLWAGLMALLNQGLGKSLGFINPILYRLSPTSGALRDITVGSNGDYQARTGWDPCTGLGVPNGNKLLAALKNPQPAPALAMDAAGVEDQFAAPQMASPLAVFSQYLRTTEKLINLLGLARQPAELHVPAPTTSLASDGDIAAAAPLETQRPLANTEFSFDPGTRTKMAKELTGL